MSKTVKEIQDESDGIGEYHERVLYAALEYAKLGYYLVPIRPGMKSLPPKTYGVGYSDATKSPNELRRWFGPEGRFKGWNIGLACGMEDGYWALDIDRGGDKDGQAVLDSLTAENGDLPDGPVAITPSGGVHRIFKWRENATSSTAKLGDALDTRGGYEDRCAGHVVIYPSTTSQGSYRWDVDGEPPEIPDWIIERMGRSWQHRKPAPVSQRGNEQLDESDYEELIPREQMQRMLDAIDPDDLSYEDWLQVGQAINSQMPDPTGLSIWDDWSSRGSRYKTGECSTRWVGFNPMGSIRAGSLYFFAGQAGWIPESKDLGPGDEMDTIIAEMNTKYAVISVAGKLRVLHMTNSGTNDPSLPQYQLMQPDGFRTLLMNQRVAFQMNGKLKVMTKADIWLAHEQRREYPKGLAMFPDGEPEGYFNTYRGFAVKPKQGDWSKFRNHIFEVICNRDTELFGWVIDWMADCVQDPGNPKGCALILQGREGTGKGTLADIFGRLWGTHYRHLIDDSHLTNNFNAHMADAILVFADEVTWGGNKKSSGKLKGMVTEKFHMVERKGVDSETFRSCLHMIIASNNDWVVPAGPESRRWLVLRVADMYRNDYSYFGKIKHEMQQEGGLEAMLYDLLEHKIVNLLNWAPETKALTQQRIESQTNSYADSAVEWWEGALADEFLDVPNDGEGDSEWPEVVDRRLLWDSFVTWARENGTGKKIPSKTAFYNRVESWGFVRFRDGVGDRRIKYKIPSVEEAKREYESLTDRTIL